jgi:hypothetical protein
MTRVRWRVVFPVVMLIVSTFLMLLAKKQEPMLWRMGTGWEVPARILNCIINGPGFYFTVLIPAPLPRSLDSHLDDDGARLLGIVFFWFLMGLSMDRRRSGRSLGQRHPIPVGILFTLGSLVCGVFAIGLGAVELGDAISWGIIAEYPLRSSHSMALAFVVWLLALCGYFCRRSFTWACQSLSPVRCPLNAFSVDETRRTQVSARKTILTHG